MHKRIRTAALVPVLAALAALLIVSGCNKQPDQPNPTPPPVVNTNYPDKIEVMPENTGETVRIHKFDQLTGREVRTEIRYRDGSTAILKLRSDGSKESYLRTNAMGKTTLAADYQTDGTVNVTAFRPDGTVNYKQQVALRQSYWGQQLTVNSVDEYAADGKTVTRTIKPAAQAARWSYDILIPQADGTVIMRGVGYNGYVMHEEHRDASGNVLSQQDYQWGSQPQEPFDSNLMRAPELPADNNSN